LRTHRLSFVVDLAFGVFLIVMTERGMHLHGRGYGWYQYHMHERFQVAVLTYVLGALELVIGVLSVFKLFNTLTFEFAVFADDGEDRPRSQIRLPSDDVEAHGAISVAA